MKISLLTTDDSLAEVAQIERGERAIVRLDRQAKIGDIIYRRLHFQEIGAFFKVTGRRKGGLLKLADLEDETVNTCLPWRCSTFGILEGGDAFFDCEISQDMAQAA